ncbi:MAG: methyltransferase domain-containing protein [Candidatus Gottesmanbacteria bacterium]
MPSLSKEQQEALSKMESGQIYHGTSFPLELIMKFLPPNKGKIILDAGCGIKLDVSEFRQAGYGIAGVDINEEAIQKTKQGEAMNAFVGDVTKRKMSPIEAINQFQGMELCDGVLAEGLLCNLIGSQPEEFFKTVDYHLAPDGFLFIADILQPTEEQKFISSILGREKARTLVEVWDKRYKINVEMGLDYGTFIVAKPGLNKKLEWETAGDLQNLLVSEDFERYSRHSTKEYIRRLSRLVKFKEKFFKPAIFHSRNGEPLLGCLVVFQKGDRYRYLGRLGRWIGKTRGDRLGDLEKRLRDLEG